MGLYPYSINRMREVISKHYPNSQAKRGLDDIPAHLLWMLDEIGKMDNIAKAGRWIGYVFGRAEALGIIDNNDSRDMARKDAHNGHDSLPT